MDHEREAQDPQWNLAVKITLQLQLHGAHEIVIDDCTDQRLVDVRWAALQAGRMLGFRPVLQVGPTPGHPPTTVTVAITSADPDTVARARARRGLEMLLRAVLEEQPTPCTPRRAVHRQVAAPRSPATSVG